LYDYTHMPNKFSENSISLNKFISDTGYCSRREADKLISAGRVQVNNRSARLGDRVEPKDTVVVDGSIMKAPKKEKLVYLALNKPVGITTTTEQHVRGNIIDFVNFPKRIFPIGRLDKDSEGLIFLTNDGDIVNKILRAGNKHEKEYIVRVNKPIDTAFIRQMSGGLTIMNERTLPCKVSATGRQTFRIILTQGLNRQIRRMCESLDYAVTSLQRVRIMNIKLDKLATGKWRYLSEPEIHTLLESVEESASENIPVPKKNAKSQAVETDQEHPKKDKITVAKVIKKPPRDPKKKPKKSSYKEYRKNKR
jgi:23S rRNA pseudouridine2604 synthase